MTVQRQQSIHCKTSQKKFTEWNRQLVAMKQPVQTKLLYTHVQKHQSYYGTTPLQSLDAFLQTENSINVVVVVIFPSQITEDYRDAVSGEITRRFQDNLTTAFSIFHWPTDKSTKWQNWRTNYSHNIMLCEGRETDYHIVCAHTMVDIHQSTKAITSAISVPHFFNNNNSAFVVP